MANTEPEEDEDDPAILDSVKDWRAVNNSSAVNGSVTQSVNEWIED